MIKIIFQVLLVFVFAGSSAHALKLGKIGDALKKGERFLQDQGVNTRAIKKSYSNTIFEKTFDVKGARSDGKCERKACGEAEKAAWNDCHSVYGDACEPVGCTLNWEKKKRRKNWKCSWTFTYEAQIVE